MGLANGPPDPLRIRRSQNVNRCQLARRLGQLAAWGMNAAAAAAPARAATTAAATATASATATTATATATATAAAATATTSTTGTARRLPLLPDHDYFDYTEDDQHCNSSSCNCCGYCHCEYR